MTANLDVGAVQQALDALITGDRRVAATLVSDDVVLTGAGGCFGGRTTGLPGVFDRFADLARLSHGTFGTEVEAVFTGNTNQVVVVTRHWASIDGRPTLGTQALIVTVDGGRIDAINALSRPGPRTGLWD